MHELALRKQASFTGFRPSGFHPICSLAKFAKNPGNHWFFKKRLAGRCIQL